MPPIAIACYRPLPGLEERLLDLVRRHHPALQAAGFATARQAFVMRAEDGTIVEVFEWTSTAAKMQAHEDAAVREIWDEMEACATFPELSSLREAANARASFEPL
jgi:hypothetical protein